MTANRSKGDDSDFFSLKMASFESGLDELMARRQRSSAARDRSSSMAPQTELASDLTSGKSDGAIRCVTLKRGLTSQKPNEKSELGFRCSNPKRALDVDEVSAETDDLRFCATAPSRGLTSEGSEKNDFRFRSASPQRTLPSGNDSRFSTNAPSRGLSGLPSEGSEKNNFGLTLAKNATLQRGWAVETSAEKGESRFSTSTPQSTMALQRGLILERKSEKNTFGLNVEANLVSEGSAASSNSRCSFRNAAPEASLASEVSTGRSDFKGLSSQKPAEKSVSYFRNAYLETSALHKDLSSGRFPNKNDVSVTDLAMEASAEADFSFRDFGPEASHQKHDLGPRTTNKINKDAVSEGIQSIQDTQRRFEAISKLASPQRERLSPAMQVQSCGKTSEINEARARSTAAEILDWLQQLPQNSQMQSQDQQERANEPQSGAQVNPSITASESVYRQAGVGLLFQEASVLESPAASSFEKPKEIMIKPSFFEDELQKLDAETIEIKVPASQNVLPHSKGEASSSDSVVTHVERVLRKVELVENKMVSLSKEEPKEAKDGFFLDGVSKLNVENRAAEKVSAIPDIAPACDLWTPHRLATFGDYSRIDDGSSTKDFSPASVSRNATQGEHKCEECARLRKENIALTKAMKDLRAELDAAIELRRSAERESAVHNREQVLHVQLKEQAVDRLQVLLLEARAARDTAEEDLHCERARTRALEQVILAAGVCLPGSPSRQAGPPASPARPVAKLANDSVAKGESSDPVTGSLQVGEARSVETRPSPGAAASFSFRAQEVCPSRINVRNEGMPVETKPSPGAAQSFSFRAQDVSPSRISVRKVSNSLPVERRVSRPSSKVSFSDPNGGDKESKSFDDLYEKMRAHARGNSIDGNDPTLSMENCAAGAAAEDAIARDALSDDVAASASSSAEPERSRSVTPPVARGCPDLSPGPLMHIATMAPGGNSRNSSPAMVYRQQQQQPRRSMQLPAAGRSSARSCSPLLQQRYPRHLSPGFALGGSGQWSPMRSAGGSVANLLCQANGESLALPRPIPVATGQYVAY